MEDRKRYKVVGGTPGIDWGELYSRHIARLRDESPPEAPDPDVMGDDLELCVFVSQEETGCTGAIYRSLDQKTIAISFRGTTTPKDLVTDASLVQTPWVQGTEEGEGVPMVHAGFRDSLDSVSRRLKELVLGAVPPDEELKDYKVLVTGHSLGGALATLFAADVAKGGFDAGRGLPQADPSPPWYERMATTISMQGKKENKQSSQPPRPRRLELYSFGSPRVGNGAFVAAFDALEGHGLDAAYRIVNDADVVARLPRTVDGFVLGKLDYDHCGPTALVMAPKNELVEVMEAVGDDGEGVEELRLDGVESLVIPVRPALWVENESDDRRCSVRDAEKGLASPLSEGTLLGDLVSDIKNVADEGGQLSNTLGKITEKVTGRLSGISVTDIASTIGIDKKYAEREVSLFQSILSGEAIFHHLEPQYFAGMAHACGLNYVIDPESMIKDNASG
mmetsp:Transcript_34102/g.78719  ORF Transcript_34102/g.78719 Transcript_34102/m.78719 type:complete len:449 (-) Transcript_34102:205-1551(-)